jgi:hypothetical protein
MIAGLPVTVTLTAVPLGTVLAMSIRIPPPLLLPASLTVPAKLELAVLTVTWQLSAPYCSTQSAGVLGPLPRSIPLVGMAHSDEEKVTPDAGALMVKVSTVPAAR